MFLPIICLYTEEIDEQSACVSHLVKNEKEQSP
jgi:hypothetical protein